MDKQMRGVVTAIAICVLLIGLKVTVFASLFQTDELIPGVTDDKIFSKIDSNSSTGNIILSDSFMDTVSGIEIESRAFFYGTNETSGEKLFKKCCDSLMGIGYDEDYIKIYPKGGKHTGVYKNETHKIVFHIFEGNDVEEYIGFYLLLTVYKCRLSN